MAEEKEYCEGEGMEFPKSEFYRDENGKWIHNVKPAHYAVTGDPVDRQSEPTFGFQLPARPEPPED